jgi:hypothetical protein
MLQVHDRSMAAAGGRSSKFHSCQGSSTGYALLVEMPFARLAAHELQGAGSFVSAFQKSNT